MLNMWFMTSNVLSTGSSKPTKRQTKKEVCETVIWAYLPCDSETETSLKLRSYIWGFLKYFCPHFACWCSGESTHSGGGIWRFGVLLHLRRFDSDFCTPLKSLEHWGVIESKRVVGWAKRCPLLITKLQGSQGLIAAMAERATSIATCARAPVRFLELCLLLWDFFPGYCFFFFFQSRLSNEECVKSCGSSVVKSSGCPLPAEYAEKLTHHPCCSGELVKVGLCVWNGHS